jgi:hypothetical protein
LAKSGHDPGDDPVVKIGTARPRPYGRLPGLLWESGLRTPGLTGFGMSLRCRPSVPAPSLLIRLPRTQWSSTPSLAITEARAVRGHPARLLSGM